MIVANHTSHAVCTLTTVVCNMILQNRIFFSDNRNIITIKTAERTSEKSTSEGGTIYLDSISVLVPLDVVIFHTTEIIFVWHKQNIDLLGLTFISIAPFCLK